MNENKELRYIHANDLQVRKAPEGEEEKMTVAGYVVKFNERSQLLWGEFYEKVSKGAFARSLKENIIKGLWNHDSNQVLGSTKSATLRLAEDEEGLSFELDLPKNEIGRNAYESISRGDVDGVSFGFLVREDNWKFLDDEDVYERTLIDIDLREISPTPFPAYEGASEVGKRSILAEKNLKTKEEREAERENEKLKISQLEMKLKLMEIEN